MLLGQKLSKGNIYFLNHYGNQGVVAKVTTKMYGFQLFRQLTKRQLWQSMGPSIKWGSALESLCEGRNMGHVALCRSFLSLHSSRTDWSLVSKCAGLFARLFSEAKFFLEAMHVRCSHAFWFPLWLLHTLGGEPQQFPTTIVRKRPGSFHEHWVWLLPH